MSKRLSGYSSNDKRKHGAKKFHCTVYLHTLTAPSSSYSFFRHLHIFTTDRQCLGASSCHPCLPILSSTDIGGPNFLPTATRRAAVKSSRTIVRKNIVRGLESEEHDRDEEPYSAAEPGMSGSYFNPRRPSKFLPFAVGPSSMGSLGFF